MRKFILIAGLLLLFVLEIMRVYWIMPFPGSQRSDSIGFAYWLGRNMFWIRIVLLLIILYPLIHAFRRSKTWKKVLLALVLVVYATIFYFMNFRMEADKMFYQPRVKTLAGVAANHVAGDKLVIGVEINGESKAYPIEVIGYHHQVRDTIGGKPVMVTYCTVCRTGRVFDPTVNGKPEQFRLVGMDHFNAMFEDAGTKSWWQQATGVAISGPLKGTRLNEIPSAQMKLKSWIRQHPQTKILQPDPAFNKKYDDLADYDNGKIDGGLEHRDTASWQFKSWVVGIVVNESAKAYDWNKLVRVAMIQDSIATVPVLLLLEIDGVSFHAWQRVVNGITLAFNKGVAADTFNDLQTGSTWNMNGEAIDGSLKGQRLVPVQAYQEFWHSWQQFHPTTTADEKVKSGSGIWRNI